MRLSFPITTVAVWVVDDVGRRHTYFVEPDHTIVPGFNGIKIRWADDWVPGRAERIVLRSATGDTDFKLDPMNRAIPGDSIEFAFNDGIRLDNEHDLNLDELRYAWTVPGPAPHIHQQAKTRLHDDWPRLHDALTHLFDHWTPR